MQFDVMFKVYDNSNKNTSTGPSHYNMTVNAINRPAAEQMVKNMNGSGRTDIIKAMQISN